MSNQDRNIKTVLGIYQNRESFNKDTFVRLELSSKTNLVKPDKNIFVLNSIEQFILERDRSNCYRINGKLEILTNNSLFGGWNDIPTDSDWDPKKVDEDNIGFNWLLQLTYPYASDDEKVMTNKTLTGTKTTIAHEGLQLDSITSTNITGRRDQVLLRTVQDHGVTGIGEYVYIRPTGLIGLEYLGFHRVVGFETNNENKGLILQTPFTVGLVNGVVKRVFEPSLEDVNFTTPNSVTQIRITNETGLLVGSGLGYTKIYDASHSLRLGDFVDIRFSEIISLNGLHKIVSIPSPNEFVVKHDLTVDYPTIPSTIIDVSSFIGSPTLGYRLIGGTPSEYYFRKFKVITNLKDYEVYGVGYSKNMFSDSISNSVDQFHFNRDIDVSNMLDNLGRPISDIYLTITKRSSNGGNSNGYSIWSNVDSMMEDSRTALPIDLLPPVTLETNSFWQTVPNNVSGSIVNPRSGDTMYGDFVEYNRAFLSEKVISRVVHRFAPGRVIPGTINWDGGVGEGYYYLPHNKIQLKTFSTVIETTQNKSDEEFPFYAQINNNGTVSWRNLLSIGFFEVGVNGVDHPFVNGCNYIYDNYAIYIRRQRPADATDIAIEENTTFVQIDPNNLGNKC